MIRIRRKETLFRRQGLLRPLLVPALAVFLLGGLSCLDVKTPVRAPLDETIGLDLDVINGQQIDYISQKLTPLTLMASHEYHIHQLRFAALVGNYPAADGYKYLQESTEFAGLDWEHAETVYETTEQEEKRVATAPDTWQKIIGLQSAGWMTAKHEFTLSFLAADKRTPLLGPFIYKASDYVISRAIASVRTAGMVKDEKTGLIWAGTGVTSQNVQPVQGGSYAGPKDEIYVLTVAAPEKPPPGPPPKSAKIAPAPDKIDPATTARLQITTVTGIDNVEKPVPIVSDVPIPLGKAGHGATVTFSDPATALSLVIGDRWLVRTHAKEHTVDAPEASIRGVMTAFAEVRFSTATSRTPIFTIPSNVKFYKITWSAKPGKEYFGDVNVIDRAAFDYGLVEDPMKVFKLSNPANGQYYMPKEKIKIAFELFDQNGKSLLVKARDPNTGKEVMSLQTYGEFARRGDCAGQSPVNPGMMYYKSAPVPAIHGFWGEHRMNVTTLYLAGPRHLVSQNYNDPNRKELKAPHTFLSTGFPPTANASNQATWDNPIIPEAEFELPADAQPGTYTILLKVHRQWLGQRTYRIIQRDIQVGSALRTEYNQTTGNCAVCHSQEAGLQYMRHFSKDDFACVICHNRPRGTAPEIVHAIHFHSPLYLQHKNDCSLCHLQPGANARASRIVCGACHEEATVHPERPDEGGDPFASCGEVCHKSEPAGHVPLPPL